MNWYGLVAYPLRLKGGDEIVHSLNEFVQKSGATSAFVLTCVGSVQSAILRFSTNETKTEVVKEYNENFEICSLVGTVSQYGAHLHVTLGRKDGSCIGGHVFELTVQTTAEIVLGSLEGAVFQRKFDPSTGFKELDIL